MTSETKFWLGILGAAALVSGIRYAQRSSAISYVKDNWSKIDFDMQSPEPKGIPMFGFRAWGYNKKTKDNTNKIILTETFPFSNVEIYKDEKGNFVID